MIDDLRAPLDGTWLRERLDRPWRQLDVVDHTGSTNADLLARAAAEDVDGAVLIAEQQSAGRGRMGRSWAAAPRAQITMSIAVAPRSVPVTAWGWLPLAAGVAVVDAVAAETHVNPGLKWPNDVLVGDRKLAGILTEVAPSGRVIVVGIGLNVTLSREEAGEPGATSLLALGVQRPDRNRLVRALLQELGRRVTQWRNTDAELLADYRVRSMTVGSRVRASLPGGREVVGVARGIDEQGRLRLESDGETLAMSAGDVMHLRPAL